MKAMANAAADFVPAWGAAVDALGMGAVIAMLEDNAVSLAREMLGGEGFKLGRAVCMGLPVFVPQVTDQLAPVAITAPGEGGSVDVPAILAGLAITAHAAEYLYFGADQRFPVTATIKAYKYLVLTEASRSAVAKLNAFEAQQYMEVLGVEW